MIENKDDVICLLIWCGFFVFVVLLNILARI